MLLHVIYSVAILKVKTEIIIFFSLEGALAMKTLETQVHEILIIV